MSSDEEPEGLVKVRVELPNHWGAVAESMWAMPLGNGHFELRNSPFYAYGLNWGDVVLAISQDEDSKPEILKVVRYGGHRTLRVFFGESISEDDQNSHLLHINSLGAHYERADGRYVAIDIPDASNYENVVSALCELQDAEVLNYETCEARIEGSFDDIPDAG